MHIGLAAVGILCQHIAGQSLAVSGQCYVIIDILLEHDAIEGLAVEGQTATGCHAQADAVAEVHNRAFVEQLRVEPHLHGELAGGELFISVVLARGLLVASNRVLPRHCTAHVGEVHGVELLQLVTLGAGHGHHHIDTLHRRTCRAVGYAARHGAGALGEAYAGHFVAEDRAVVAFVLHGDAVVVVNAGQCRLVGIEQIVFVARQAGQHLPCLLLLFGTASLHDVGLGIEGALLVHMPRQLHRSLIAPLRGIERVELCSLADGLRVDGHGVEHSVANDTLYAVGLGGAGVQRLLGIGHARLRVNLVLSVAVLVSGSVLPLQQVLHVGGCECVDGVLLAIDIDTELVAEAFGIGIGGPCKHDAVGLLFHLQVAHGHFTRGVDSHRGLRVVALRRQAPEVRDIVHVVGRRRLVGEAVIGVGVYAGSEFGYLRAVTIDHPLEIGVVARNGRNIPREVHPFVALIEYAVQVGGLDDGRVDGDSLRDDVAVVGEDDAAGRGAFKLCLHFIVAHIDGSGHGA